jgi:hypothetical protein
MKTINDLKDLMFNASKLVDNTQQPPRYRVRGFPDNNSSGFDYANFKTDFTFASYENVIAGGLLRCARLFNKPYSDMEVHKLNYGRHKQWFICELIAKKNRVKIDGEWHFPFLSISYSYDRVNAIHYEIGIYREKCSNGMLFGFRTLLNLHVTPQSIFDVEVYYNPCMLFNITGEYERRVKMLKNTTLDRNTITALVNSAMGFGSKKNVGNMAINISGELVTDDLVPQIVEDYIGELGSNAYAALNAITDLSSNYDKDKSDKNDNLDAQVTAKQRKAGKWLERMIEYVERSNHVFIDLDPSSPNYGIKPVKESYDFSLSEFMEYIKS